GFKETWWGSRVWSAAEANAVTDPQVFATDTVFKPKPDSIMDTTATRLETDRHLAYGIPALSPATGRITLQGRGVASRDMNSEDFMTNSWPRPADGGLGGRFLHSDIKNVAYLFVYPVFSAITGIGGLTP
ncbi:MAG: hypothetical protein IJS32_05705, partial [Kiritimatiellae bacterium]|nr:hypothetical protein [Kiritimatiellia bacterium]